MLDTWDSLREHSGGNYADQDGGAEAIMRGLRPMAAELRLAFLVVHHATRGNEGRARGTVVFDARCDWIAIVEPGESGLTLRTIKARDGECGPVGVWAIRTVPMGDRPVPVLVYTGDRPTAPQGGQRDDDVLAAAAEIEEQGGAVSIRALAKACGISSTSTVQGIVERLRRNGRMEDGSYSPTTAAVRASFSETPLNRGANTPRSREHQTANSTEKPVVFDRTEKTNTPTPFARSPSIEKETRRTGAEREQVERPDRDHLAGRKPSRAERQAAPPTDDETGFDVPDAASEPDADTTADGDRPVPATATGQPDDAEPPCPF
ncbi:MAG: hypothetical protein V4515_14670 [Chloroflexota bacterium]